MAKDAQQGIRSLETGLLLFQTLHRLKRPATLGELAKLAAMPPSKVHRYCVSLIRAGLMQRDGRGLYGIGPFCFQFSDMQSEREHARRLAVAALPGLVCATGETVFLSAWGQTGPIVLHVEEAPRPFAVRPTSRGDMPLLNSATGRVFAAYLDAAKLEALIKAELAALKREQKLSAAAIADCRHTFFRHLADVHKRGLARTTGERFRGVKSFSGPIFNHRGEVVLAISCHGLAATFPSAWDSPVAMTLRQVLADLTRQIGGKRPQRALSKGRVG
jgi:DNA-binding IclR family transcriptional regulator